MLSMTLVLGTAYGFLVYFFPGQMVFITIMAINAFNIFIAAVASIYYYTLLLKTCGSLLPTVFSICVILDTFITRILTLPQYLLDR